MPLLLGDIKQNDPFGYFKNPKQFEQFVQDATISANQWHSYLWLFYTDEQIQIPWWDIQSSYNGRPMATGQELGLPPRILGYDATNVLGLANETQRTARQLKLQRKEPVTQNEIGWRVDTVNDYLYGEHEHKPRLCIKSELEEENPELAEQIDELLKAVFDANGGGVWFSQFGQKTSVHGWADVLVMMKEGATVNVDKDGNRIEGSGMIGGVPMAEGQYGDFAKNCILTIADPRDVVPLVVPREPNQLWGWVLYYKTSTNPSLVGAQTSIDDLMAREEYWLEIYTPGRANIFRSVGKGEWESVASPVVPGGILPVVHCQHNEDRRRYAALGEVEPLIALQSELNTRLSDRAYKTTMAAYKMYFGKGLEKEVKRDVGPGIMWNTANPEAEISTIGDDTKDEGEDIHILQVREALDRISCVPPVAAGDIKDQIGNLTSAAALNVVLRGFQAKLTRVRRQHRAAIEQICAIILLYANEFGVLKTTPEQRAVRVEWSMDIAASENEKLQNATMKKALGIPQETLWKELGYTDEQIAEMSTQAEEEQRKLFDMSAELGAQVGDNANART